MKFKNFLNEFSKEYVSVYHVSPRSDMFKLRATGHSKGVRSLIGKGQPGLFVAPKFRDAVAWAVTYVSGKKVETQRPNSRLKEKEEGGGFHGEKGPGPYKKLTIYEIRIPKDALRSSVYTGWWEPEYFITADHLKDMKIVKSKTYSIYELSGMYQRTSNQRSLNAYPKPDSYILKASKTNFAARAYLELVELYNSALMKGKVPVLREPTVHGTNHLIRQEIDSLKKYIFNPLTFRVEIISKVDKEQENEVKEIYERVKKLILKL